MYNPVNMKIEDAQRLYERDLREKNKKARYEVRYDMEATTRKESLAEQDRMGEMAVNKISGMRYREEIERGHHILSNQALEGRAIDYKSSMYGTGANPTNAWNTLASSAFPKVEVHAEQAAQLQEANHVASEQKAPSQAAEGSKRSQHPVISTRSQKPSELGSRASQASKPAAVASQRSNAAAPAVSETKAASAAASRASVAPPKSNQSKAVSSRREIRTGGFSKLGEEIMQK